MSTESFSLGKLPRFRKSHQMKKRQSSTVSHGIILFNEEGELLTLVRPHSYAWDSIMLQLTVPKISDIDIYINMIKELTEEEYYIFKNNWYEKGIDNIIKYYLFRLVERLPNVEKALNNKFKSCKENILFSWNDLIRKLDISKIKPTGLARIHDFPKKRKIDNLLSDAEILFVLRCKFYQDTGQKFPVEVTYGSWVSVEYESVDGEWYTFELLPVKCKKFKLFSDVIKWIQPISLQIVEEVRKIIIEAWQGIANK